MSRFVHLHPLVTVVAVSAFAAVWGIPGALVAVPLSAMVQRVTPLLLRGEEEACAPEQDSGAEPAAGPPPSGADGRGSADRQVRTTSARSRQEGAPAGPAGPAGGNSRGDPDDASPT